MDPSISWFIIDRFVIGFMSVLCFGLAVLANDLDNRREQNNRSGNHSDTPGWLTLNCNPRVQAGIEPISNRIFTSNSPLSSIALLRTEVLNLQSLPISTIEGTSNDNPC